jgi:hypothetical protein
MTDIKASPLAIPPLPDDLIESLRQVINDADRHQWATGDFLVGIVDELEDNYTRLGVRHARAWLIQHMANRVGCDASTLRDREAMARFYPGPVRARYDALSYHQLRACKAAGNQWQEYADWALDNLPAPVATIRAKIKHNGDLPPAWVSRWERVQVLCEALKDDAQAPPGVRLAARLISMGLLTRGMS